MATVTEIANMSSLETAQDLGKAGFDQKQAEALAKCFHDLSVMVSRQIAELGAEIRKQTEENRKETDRKVDEISKGIRNAILAMAGMIITSIGIMVALVIHLT